MKIPMLQKELRLITPEDLREFIASGHPEGVSVEFKESLSTKAGTDDPWQAGENRISDKARNALLEVIVAFANAEGGNLLIGVRESKERPPRATEIVPLPACTELAERLSYQARDCIEPKIPAIECCGVTMRGDGAGVVIIRVGRSRLAPHRLIPTRDSYVRRADRCDKLTMREIHELTINRYSEDERLTASFEQRQRGFGRRMLAESGRCSKGDLVASRVTLIPTASEVHLPNVDSLLRLGFCSDTYNAQVGDEAVKLLFRLPLISQRAILRGISAVFGEDRTRVTCEALTSGLVEYIIWDCYGPGEDALLHPGLVLGALANALVTAQRIRSHAGFPQSEYGLELEVAWPDGTPLRLRGFSYGVGLDSASQVIEANPLTLPRLSVGSLQELPTIVDIVRSDLWNAAGVTPEDGLILRPDSLFLALQRGL